MSPSTRVHERIHGAEERKRYFFIFHDTATTQIYTLSLHDALPILQVRSHIPDAPQLRLTRAERDRGVEHAVHRAHGMLDRKSTRLNSSHPSISYAVFCLKKKIRHEKQAERGRGNVVVARDLVALQQ